MHAAGEPDERQCLRIEVSDLELCSVGPVSREAFVIDGEAAQHLHVVQAAHLSQSFGDRTGYRHCRPGV